ncbi:MAG: methyltransferase [Saprospiraceae bacterium]|nr:methyltransferase [Saprospiraceae bacterium]
MDVSKPFFFKQFAVAQDKVTMKVGTDGVLLGAWVDIQEKTSALDVGTGTGLIALILAQRMKDTALVDAVDIDPGAIEQARDNFQSSPWAERLFVHQEAIQEYSNRVIRKYDIIVSNPPFFTGGMLSEFNTKNDVRHTIKLPHGDLLRAVSRLLLKEGSLGLILPYLQGLRFIEISESYGLYPKRITVVRTRADKPVERLLLELSYDRSITPIREELIIHADQTAYSEAYQALTRPFYLNF